MTCLGRRRPPSGTVEAALRRRPGFSRRASRGRPASRVRARRTVVRRSWADDAGGIGVLGIGLFACLAMLVLGGLCVHTAQVARVDVLDAADHAGAAAADRISVAAVYEKGVGAPTLDPGLVSAETSAVLASTPLPPHVAAWRVAEAHADGAEITVSVVATVQPPAIGGALAALGAPLTVSVTSHAQAHLER